MSNSSNSGASFIERNRPPRVHIAYELETNGAQRKVELPFVMGVMADLSGAIAEGKELAPVQDRKFADVSVDNFNDFMKSITPRVAMKRVLNLLEGTPVEVSHPAVVALKINASKDGIRYLSDGFHKIELNGTEVQVDVYNDEKDPEKHAPSYTLYDKVLSPVQIEFENMGDFSPEAVAKKVGPLNELLETRRKLANLTAWVDGRVAAEKTLGEIIQDSSLLKAFADASPPPVEK